MRWHFVCVWFRSRVDLSPLLRRIFIFFRAYFHFPSSIFFQLVSFLFDLLLLCASSLPFFPHTSHKSDFLARFTWYLIVCRLCNGHFLSWHEPNTLSTTILKALTNYNLLYFSLLFSFQYNVKINTGENPAAMQHASSNRCSPIEWIHLYSLIAMILSYRRWL